MLKKILSAVFIFCIATFIFGGKSFAAEFEMVSYSALLKLQWLASSGNPDAQKILKDMGKSNIYSKKNLADFDRIEKVNAIFQELNYLSTVEYVQKNNYKNIIDIGGGYSPRAVVFVNEGRKYFGAELEAIAQSALGFMPKFIDAKYKKNLFYDEVLAEDRSALYDAVNTIFSGETSSEVSKQNICLVEQGLMVYLTKDRVEKMYDNMANVLQLYGGCYITSDFVLNDLFKDISAAVYGESESQKLFDETQTMYEKLLDDDLHTDNFKSKSEAINFLNARGLKVQEVPLLTDTSKLYCTKNLTPQQAEKINQIAQKKYLWVITAK